MAILQCGLQITSETISALALKPVKGGWSVAGGAMTQIATEGAELAPPIKALARSLKAGGAPFAMALPKQQGIMRTVTLPSTDPAELAQMARFEIERYIPFHAERHCSGYHLMRKMGVEGSEVVLAAIDGPVVQRAVDAAMAADLSPDGVTLSSIALCNAMMFSRRDWLQGKTVAVLSIGLDTLDLVLMTDGRILFARSVAIDLRSVLEARLGWGGDNPKSRPDLAHLAHMARMTDCMKVHMQAGESDGNDALLAGWLGRIVQEIRRTYDFARREMKCPPVEAVMITGEGAILNNLDEYFRANVDAEVVVVNPLAGLDGAAAHKFPFDGFEFTIAFGAAVAGALEGAYRIDLTPADHYRNEARKRTRRKLTFTGAVFAVALLLAGASWYRYETIHRQYLDAYNAINEKMRPLAGELQEKQKRLAIIERYMKDPNNAMTVLANIGNSQTMPARGYTASVRSVSYTMNETISVNGHAKSPIDLNRFKDDLNKSCHGTAWNVPASTAISLWGFPVYEFTINGVITKQGGK